jgi:hypothetical protein
MSAPAGFRRLFLAAALALLAVPTAATASPLGFPFDLPEQVPPQLRAQVPSQMAPSKSPLPFLPTFVLEPRGGYRIGVIGIGDAVLLEVVRKHRRAMTAYVARGTVTSRRLQASFGEFGEVTMRFHPSPARPWQEAHRRCKGAGRFINRSGVFVGRVRFRGENGYVSVNARRAKGQVSGLAPQCRRGGFSKRPGYASGSSQRGQQSPQLAFLGAGWRHGVNSTSFGVLGLGAKALFLASTAQSLGRLAIFRMAIAEGARNFTVDNALTLARVNPPAPFEGTGTYRAGPDGTKTWTGKLAVDLLGAPHLPLTGPLFKAALDASF